MFQTVCEIQILEEAGDKELKEGVEQSEEWLAKQDLSKLDPKMLTPLTEEVGLRVISFGPKDAIYFKDFLKLL